MTKAEFVNLLEGHFRAIVSSVTQNTISDIQGHSARMDGQTFADWLRSEIASANAEPALKVFDRVLRPSHSTPHEAAHSLAGLIEMDVCHFVNDAGKMEFDPNRANWQEHRERVFLAFSKPHLEGPNAWKYRKAVADYIAALRAETRARVLSEFAEKTKGMDYDSLKIVTRTESLSKGERTLRPLQAAPAPKVVPKAEPKYDFEALFIEGAKDRFLRAAKKAGMIDSAGKWVLGDRKKWVLLAAWNLAFSYDLTTPGLNDFAACKAIAEHWGITISQTTFEGYWSARREDHSTKRGFDSFSRFLQDLTRG